jgi:hypothetical protein
MEGMQRKPHRLHEAVQSCPLFIARTGYDAGVIGRMTLEMAEALREVLAEGEAVVAALPSIGSSLVLTDRRLIIIRDGRSFRPRSGVRDWPLGPALRIQVGPLRNGAGSLLIDRERGATSFFVSERDWQDALWIVEEAARRSQVSEAG